MDYIVDHALSMLPCALAAALVFFCSTPGRRRRLAGKGRVSGPWRETGLLLFVMFVAGLASITLTPSNFWRSLFRGETISWPVPFSNEANLVPLVGILYGLRRMNWLSLQVVGNVVMFLPLGFFPALLWEGATWKRALLTGFCSSLFVECFQLFVVRGTDIDDLILNTLGALCGYWLYRLLATLAPGSTGKFICQRQEAP